MAQCPALLKSGVVAAGLGFPFTHAVSFEKAPVRTEEVHHPTCSQIIAIAWWWFQAAMSLMNGQKLPVFLGLCSSRRRGSHLPLPSASAAKLFAPVVASFGEGAPSSASEQPQAASNVGQECALRAEL